MSEAVYPFDLLEVEGAVNVRDIGGYPGADGRPVNKGRFIRAGAMNSLTAAGVRAVRALGVDCIVDLRSRAEVARHPDTLAEDGEIAYAHIPMLDYIQSSLAGMEKGMPDSVRTFPASMAEMYVGLLEKAGAEFLRVFRVLGDPGHRTVLFHCTAGKDRTGVTAMLLLGLAGVPREVIVADYSYSEQFFDPPPEGAAFPRYLFESAPATMEAAIDHLEGEYGGIRPYLEAIGVDKELMAAVLHKLLG